MISLQMIQGIRIFANTETRLGLRYLSCSSEKNSKRIKRYCFFSNLMELIKNPDRQTLPYVVYLATDIRYLEVHIILYI